MVSSEKGASQAARTWGGEVATLVLDGQWQLPHWLREPPSTARCPCAFRVERWPGEEVAWPRGPLLCRRLPVRPLPRGDTVLKLGTTPPLPK